MNALVTTLTRRPPLLVGEGRGEVLFALRRTVSSAIITVLIAVPTTAVHAETLKDIINNNVIPIFNSAVGFIMVLALLGFIAGVIRFMYTAGDDKSRSDGKTLMVWGTVALFLMISIWGIVTIVRNTFFQGAL